MNFKHWLILVFILSFSILVAQKVKKTEVYFPYPNSKQLHEEFSSYKKKSLNIYHGNFTSYYVNGSIHIKAQYENGNLIGEYKEYYESGKLAVIENFDSFGNSTLKKYFENGKEMFVSIKTDNEETIIKRGYENGNYILYSNSDQLEYYNSADELIKTISKENDFKLNESKSYYINYPMILLDHYKEGVILVEIEIEKSGVISKLNVLESFDQKASDAVTSVLEKINPDDLKSNSKKEMIVPFEFVID